MNQPNQPTMELTLDELYTIIGELEVVRRKTFMQAQKDQKQIQDMSAEITKLRTENGKLESPDTH
jgi:hypothetical protein